MTISKQTLITGLVFALLASVGTWFALVGGETVKGAAFYSQTVLSTATTSTAIAVTSSTRVLATTTNALGTGTSYTRVYATICNPSTTLVYLNMNGDKVANTSSAQAIIAAAAGYNACYEITDRNSYSGSVQASSTNQTSTSVIVTDYVQ